MDWKHNLMLAGLIAPLALAGASLAQPAPAPAGPHAREMQMQRPDPAAMAEKHAQHLRDVLQLRPEQEGALKALVESMRPPEGMMEHPMGDEEAGLSTPQRLDRMLAHLEEHRTMMVRHIEAVKRFYAQLSPSQQKAFDALHAGGMDHMGMGMGEGHRMMFMRHMGLGEMDHPGGPEGSGGPGHE